MFYLYGKYSESFTWLWSASLHLIYSRFGIERVKLLSLWSADSVIQMNNHRKLYKILHHLTRTRHSMLINSKSEFRSKKMVTILYVNSSTAHFSFFISFPWKILFILIFYSFIWRALDSKYRIICELVILICA